MNIQNLISFCQFILKILSKNQILTWIKGHNSVANLRKTTFFNTNVDLVNDDLVLFCQLVLKKKQILTSIKGRNSVANLRKTKNYNTNVDNNVYTKFGLNLSIRSQEIEQNPNSDVNQGPYLFCKFAKKIDLHYQRRSCQSLCVYKIWS